jgi:hypothetical protein
VLGRIRRLRACPHRSSLHGVVAVESRAVDVVRKIVEVELKNVDDE